MTTDFSDKLALITEPALRDLIEQHLMKIEESTEGLRAAVEEHRRRAATETQPSQTSGSTRELPNITWDDVLWSESQYREALDTVSRLHSNILEKYCSSLHEFSDNMKWALNRGQAYLDAGEADKGTSLVRSTMNKNRQKKEVVLHSMITIGECQRIILEAAIPAYTDYRSCFSCFTLASFFGAVWRYEYFTNSDEEILKIAVRSCAHQASFADIRRTIEEVESAYYWSTHPKEESVLRNEVNTLVSQITPAQATAADLRSQLQQLNNRIDSHSVSQLNANTEAIAALNRKLNSLGLFQRKAKRAAREELAALKEERPSLMASASDREGLTELTDQRKRLQGELSQLIQNIEQWEKREKELSQKLKAPQKFNVHRLAEKYDEEVRQEVARIRRNLME